jgi:hypothetical protein
MGILYPSKVVASRWHGALEARLRRAPLEAFLRTRGLEVAAVGASRDTDNLVRATACLVTGGLELYFNRRSEGLAYHQRPVVAHVACLVSLALAQQIYEPDLWRNAALVSSTKVLSSWIGMNAASLVSVTATREFQGQITCGASPSDWRISKSACEAVNLNESHALARAAWSIAARLNAEPAPVLVCATERESQPG